MSANREVSDDRALLDDIKAAEEELRECETVVENAKERLKAAREVYDQKLRALRRLTGVRCDQPLFESLETDE
jgi:hypothetical protein